MHHLIKSMHKCLREAISNDGYLTIGNFCFYTASIPVFCIKRLFIFSFILLVAVLFIFIIWILITNNNR